jgi:aquaporin Z
VTLGFWLMQKLDARTALGYVCAQLVGAALGSLPLLAWGAMGRSVDFGATVPGEGYMTMDALLGAVVTTSRWWRACASAFEACVALRPS